MDKIGYESIVDPDWIEAQPKVFTKFISDKTNCTTMIGFFGIDVTRIELVSNVVWRPGILVATYS